MKVKNLNPIEQHVEKIVLGVAVLAAAYIGYVGLQNVTIKKGGASLQPAQVEQQIKDAVASLQSKTAQTERYVENGRAGRRREALVIADMQYLNTYRQMVDASMPRHLTAPVARAMPAQYSPGQVDTQPGTRSTVQYALGLPMPKLFEARAEVGRGVIIEPQPAAPGTPTPTPGAPMAGVERDATIVRVSAAFPMRELRDVIANTKNPKQAVPPNLQVVVIKGFEVERLERNADGTWPTEAGAWKPVAPLKITPPPPQVPVEQFPQDQLKPDAALRGFVEYTPIALQPPMYPQPAPAPGKAVAEFFPPLPAASMPSTNPATGPKAGVPGVVRPPVAPVNVVRDPETGEPIEGSLFPGVPHGSSETTGSLLGAEAVRVWTYDENVRAEHEYKYRARVSVFNPLYKFPEPAKFLANKADAEKPWLTTDWVQIDKSVYIEPDAFFFITGNGGLGGSGRDTVDVQLFRFMLGHWHMVQTPSPIGVGAPVAAVLPATKSRTGNAIPFETGYTIVDIIPQGRDATVVLLSSSGQLVTRSMVDDIRTRDSKGLVRLATPPKDPRPVPGPGGPTRGPRGPLPPGPAPGSEM